MKHITLGQSDISCSTLSLGCLRIADKNKQEAVKILESALAGGINFFDHADGYGRGKSEEIFAEALNELQLDRSEIFLQSKCGIRSGYFDFSKSHILQSVDEILKRLDTDYIDVLLLHRPDALMEPPEIAEAFSALRTAGKVRHFGVSNQNVSQLALLQDACEMPLVANQIQMSIAHCPGIDHGFNVNMINELGVDRDNGVIEYCRLHGITLQPWSPLQFGFMEGVFLDHPDYKTLNETLIRLGEQYSVTPSAIAIAWLLRHPANMQPILGSMNPGRIQDMCRADDVFLTRQEWYELYQAAGKTLP